MSEKKSRNPWLLAALLVVVLAIFSAGCFLLQRGLGWDANEGAVVGGLTGAMFLAVSTFLGTASSTSDFEGHRHLDSLRLAAAVMSLLGAVLLLYAAIAAVIALFGTNTGG